MKAAGPSGWRGVMNRRPQPSEFGLSPLADNVDSLTQRHQPRPRISRIQNGIGGGMRFADEHELLRVAPSRFSGDFMGRQLSLTGGRVIMGVYCCVLLTVLLVAHVHLRFQIHDMKMQEHMLQSVHRQLERRLSNLDRGVAHRMGDLAPLREAAITKLNMVPNSRTLEVAIAPSLLEKYSPQAIAEVTGTQNSSVAAAQPQRRNPFRKLADLALAFVPDRPLPQE
jgi:hypothetical protein